MELALIIGEKEQHTLISLSKGDMVQKTREQQLSSSHVDPSPRRCTDGVDEQRDLNIKHNDLAGFLSSIPGF